MQRLNALIAATLAGTAVFVSPSAQASFECGRVGTGYPIGGVAAVDTVSPSEPNQWRHTYTDPSTTYRVSLQPIDGDADLDVRDHFCNPLCASINGGSAADVCYVKTASGLNPGLNIGVSYYAPGTVTSDVTYILSVIEAP